MNIFDGYEDKTPEELAKELGISDLAVVKNAGRESAEVLDNQNTLDTNENSIDESIWTKNFVVSMLKEGMEVKIYGNLLGTIQTIHENSMYVIFPNGNTAIYNFNKDKDNIEIKLAKNMINGEWIDYVKVEKLEIMDFMLNLDKENIDFDLDDEKITINWNDGGLAIYDLDANGVGILFDKIFVVDKEEGNESIENNEIFGEWVDITDIERLEIGMEIKDANSIGKIHSFNENEKGNGNGFKIMRDDDTSISNITTAIPPNSLYIFLYDETKYCNQAKWTQQYKFSNLEEGMKVRNSGESGYIECIKNRDDIVIRWEDNSQSNYDYSTIKKSIEIDITIKISSIEDLHKGMFIKNKSSENIYIINGFSKKEGIDHVIIKDPNTKQWDLIPWGKFIFERKAIKNNKVTFDKLPQEDLDDLDKWTNEFNISKLKSGMNMSTSKNGPGHIISNGGNLLTVKHYNGKKELYSQKTFNQLAIVYKDDLKNPWTSDFTVKDLGKGMGMDMNGELCIIDKFGKDDITIHIKNGNKHIFSKKDIEKSFKANKFDLY